MLHAGHDELVMLMLRMSSSLVTLSMIFLDFSSTTKHFHYATSSTTACQDRGNCQRVPGDQGCIRLLG